MPNWCTTNIEFICKNKKAENILENGFQNFQKAMNDDSPETNRKYKDNNGFGKNWLGNFWPYFGLEYPGNDCGISHRGEVTSFDKLLDNSYGFITYKISTETAWSPCLKMWRDIFDKLDITEEDVYVGYEAIEEGCQLYINDGYSYDDEYYIEDGELSDWIPNDEILGRWIQKSKYIDSKDKNLSLKRMKEGKDEWRSEKDYEDYYTLCWYRFSHISFLEYDY